MKTLNKLSLLAAGLVMLFGCQEEALEKAAVESGFAPSAVAPTVSIDLETYTINNVEGIAVVSLTVEGITAEMDSLEVGFIAGTDSTFTKSSLVAIENPADGTYTDTVKVVPGKKNYVQAYASILGASSLSEVLVLDVPDIEWYKKLPKQYGATIESYFEEEYTSVISVSFDADNGVVYFSAFDPYLADNGLKTTYTAGIADLEDVEHPTVNFTITDGRFFLSDQVGAIAYYSLVAVPLDDNFSPVDSYKITFNKAMDEMTVQAWGLYEDSDDPGWWEKYPTVVYKEMTN